MTARVDETVRQTHYGEGRQVWDTIVEKTDWGPAFAAGNVLKYLRRDKSPEHSLESARWYWNQLVERSKSDRLINDWRVVRFRLWHLLTEDERARLEG
jgi:hypothetical protein